MLKKNYNQGKLIPLRKFAVTGIYSSAYLSQLVQRKKLKAKRIGRNFFSTTEWFEEYLERHGRDEKLASYRKYQIKLNKNHKLTLDAENESYRLLDRKGVNFFIANERQEKAELNKKYLWFRSLAYSMIVFFILIGVNIFYVSWQNDKGRIAGEDEVMVDNGGATVKSMSEKEIATTTTKYEPSP